MEEKEMNFYNYAKQNPCKHINTHTPAKGMAAAKTINEDCENTQVWKKGEKVK